MVRPITFVCTCGSKKVEEIVFGVVQSSEIEITDDGYLEYGEVSYDGGGEDGDTRYQCKECGHVISDKHGRPIRLDGIAVFLTKEKGDKDGK